SGFTRRKQTMRISQQAKAIANFELRLAMQVIGHAPLDDLSVHILAVEVRERGGKVFLRRGLKAGRHVLRLTRLTIPDVSPGCREFQGEFLFLALDRMEGVTPSSRTDSSAEPSPWRTKLSRDSAGR